MKAEYIDHMGSDASVVRADRCFPLINGIAQKEQGRSQPSETLKYAKFFGVVVTRSPSNSCL